MKRVLAVLLACVMVFGVSATVFAADSPSPTGTDDLEYVEINADYITVTVDGTEVDAEYIYSDDDNYDAAVELYSDPEGVLEEVVDDADGYEIAYLMDVTPDDTSAATVEFSADDIAEADGAILLHCVDGVWVEVDSELSDGVLTADVDSFSPFAIYILSDEDTDDDTEDTEDTEEDTSDTTGESSMVLLITVLAVLAAAGAAVSCKKIRE